MAGPRESFAQRALSSISGIATLLTVTLAAWSRWRGDPSIYQRKRCDAARVCREGAARRRPEPIDAFPELRPLRIHEPWLANSAVRGQCVWEDVGFGGDHYKYFVLDDGRRGTLGILLRGDELVNMRLHTNVAMAAVDGALWAGEIRDRPVRRAFVCGGIDRRRHRTWTVHIVQRQGRWELQITNNGLIPWTRDYRSVEDATEAAEQWLTDLHEGDAMGGRTSTRSPDGGWVM